MRQTRLLKGIRFVFFAALACLVLGFVVRGLWNLLIPPIFGWHTISFWQAIGLLVLSKILFGGFHGHSHGSRNQWKNRIKDRMEHMTPEQREQFRKGMRCYRGPFTSPAEPQV